jgi:hypothetical protein
MNVPGGRALLPRQVHRAINERLWLARGNHRLALDFLAIGALPALRHCDVVECRDPADRGTCSGDRPS